MLELHTHTMDEAERGAVQALLRSQGLALGEDADITVRCYSEGKLCGCGSLCGYVLKYIAVSPTAEGEGVCARIVTELVSHAARQGIRRLFLYTKPENGRIFRTLGFYDIVQTRSMLMMEDRKDGLSSFLAGLPRPNAEGSVGAVVMNADPFTNGHLHLVRTAAAAMDFVYVFVLSEEGGAFPASVRYELVRRGTLGIGNIAVCQSSRYLVSRATFPDYFLKDKGRVEDERAELDIALFGKRIAPELGITHRFVGEEPYSEVTDGYNRRMAELLPDCGVRLTVIPRLGGISAGRVRELAAAGRLEEIRAMVPEATFEYIQSNA